MASEQDVVIVLLTKLRVLLAFAVTISTCLSQLRSDDSSTGGCLNSTQGLSFEGIVSEYGFPFSGDMHYEALEGGLAGVDHSQSWISPFCI